MERSDALTPGIQPSNHTPQFIVKFQIRDPLPRTAELFGKFFATGLTLLRLVCREKSGDSQVACEAQIDHLLFGHRKFLGEHLVRRLVGGIENLSARIQDMAQTRRHVAKQRAFFLRLPVECLDLMRGEADKRIAAAQRVIHEGERMIFGEGREPE